MLAIFISEVLSPDRSVVISKTSPVPTAFPSLIFGDTFPINLYIVDGDGGYATISGDLNSTVKVGVGIRGEPTAWLNATWTRVPAVGWTGTVTVNSAEVLALFDGQTSVNVTFEVRISSTNGAIRTYASVPFDLLAPAIDATAAEDESPISTAARTLYLVAGDNVTIVGNLVTVTSMAFGAVPTSVIVSINIPTADAGMFPATVITASLTADGFQFVMGGLPDNNDYTFTFVPVFA